MILSVKIRGVFFIVLLSKVALSHRNAVSARTACDSSDVQGSSKRDAV
jgi:hypothetical protein